MQFMTPTEVAEALRVSTKTVYRWIAAGEIPAIEIGHFYRIDRAEFETYLQNRHTAASRNGRGRTLVL